MNESKGWMVYGHATRKSHFMVVRSDGTYMKACRPNEEIDPDWLGDPLSTTEHCKSCEKQPVAMIDPKQAKRDIMESILRANRRDLKQSCLSRANELRDETVSTAIAKAIDQLTVALENSYRH